MRKLFLALVAVANTGYASLTEKPSELVLSGTGALATEGGVESVSLYGEYLHHVFGHVQLGAELGMNYVSGVGGLSYSLLAGPTFNLSAEDFENSAFLTARAGLVYSGFDPQDATRAKAEFGLGHRFQIFDNVVYRPQLTLNKRFGDGTGWVFGVEPIAFSIVF